LEKKRHEYKNKAVQDFPLEKLHDFYSNLHFKIEKWLGKRADDLVRTLPFNGFYTILQYLNRSASLAGGSLLLTNKIDAQTGGIITTASAGTEIILSYFKDRILGLEERSKLFDNLIGDIEDTYISVGGLVETLRPIRPFPFSKELNEALDVLKMKLDKFLEKKDKHLKIVERYKGDNLRLILEPGKTKKLI